MNVIDELASRIGLARVGLAVYVVVASTMLTAACVAQDDVGPHLLAQSSELLPAPGPNTVANVELPAECQPVPPDPPLSALSVDVEPRNRNGQIVAREQLPENCAVNVVGQAQFPSVPIGCASCRPSLCELLQPAQFCHQPLYFDDDCLERYGVRACACQPAASAVVFYGDALLLPVKMLRQCPNDCVRTHTCY